MGPHRQLVKSHLKQLKTLLLTLICFTATPVSAGLADVLKVEIDKAADGSFAFHVTVRHADSGWDHYANRWEVIGPQGEIIAKRVLWHPHVHEQPFTRSLSGVNIPKTMTWVKLRAHDKLHRFGGREVTLSVPH